MTKKIFLEGNLPDLLDEIQKTVRQAVQNEIKLMSANLKKTYKPVYLSRQEVCTKFGISYPTLHRHINNGVIECLKIGRRSLFEEKQITESLIKLNTKGGNL